MIKRRAWTAVALLLAMAGAVRPALALGPENILLVCNGNSQTSVRLAEFYARARAIPDGRIVKLDLPGSEEIPYDTFERAVVPPVREFIKANGLAGQVTCLVTFTGVPIRVAARKLSPADEQEAEQVTRELAGLEQTLRGEVRGLEQIAGVNEGGGGGEGVDQLAARADAAGRVISQRLAAERDPVKQKELYDRTRQAMSAMVGDAGLLERFAVIELRNPTTTADARQRWTDLAKTVEAARRDLSAAQDQRYDPVERTRARQLALKHFGLFNAVKLARGQVEAFATNESQASLDSELALLWWGCGGTTSGGGGPPYPRARWLTNALHYAVTPAQRATLPPVLMVSRLDGPEDSSAADITLGALKAERDGLRGRIVLDSRGLKAGPDGKLDGYATYDQSLRDLYALLRAKTKWAITWDERPEVFPAGSVKQVALYCGWYSVGNYVPAFEFVPGAVGFHVASFELLSLRDPKNNGWVKGMLRDGVAATAGPVSEPYLFAFPPADEFFPLLLTGKLTLAECWWRTSPTVSWQMSLIGDPLYRPFAKAPVLQPGDLPPRLRAALEPLYPNGTGLTDAPPATRP